MPLWTQETEDHVMSKQSAGGGYGQGQRQDKRIAFQEVAFEASVVILKPGQRCECHATGRRIQVFYWNVNKLEGPSVDSDCVRSPIAA